MCGFTVTLRLASLIILLGAIVIALGYAHGLHNQSPEFLTAPVERGESRTLVSATGTVEAQITVYVSSQLSGRIDDVLVDYNDAVTKGQPLATLDQETFVSKVNEASAALKIAVAAGRFQEAAIRRARLAVINAHTDQSLTKAEADAAKAKQDEVERDFERKLKLARSGSVSERDLSQARTARDVGAAEMRAWSDKVKMKGEAVEMAEADLIMAEANLENAQAVIEQKRAALAQAEQDFNRTVLRSPIDGIILDRDVDAGETIAVALEAKALFVLANRLDEMEVHGKIDEADVGKLKVGQAAKFTVDAYPDRVFSGRIRQIRKAPEVVQNVVSYTAVVSAPNPGHLLIPGLTADLSMVVEDYPDGLRVPNQALRFQPEGIYRSSINAPEESAGVWVLANDGKPQRVPLKTGQSDDHSTQVLEGDLREGQLLIVGIANERSRPSLFGLRVGL